MKLSEKKYFGTPQWLKAPNGKPTNLTELQWLQVRTPNFKRWFGDWEKHPELASKVLDENGEPLVVYHGTPNGGFSVFKTEGKEKTEGTGAFFHSNYQSAQTYTIGDKGQNGQIYAVFLNIRNPFIYESKGRSWNELGDVWIYNHDTGEEFETKQDGSYFLNQDDAYEYISDVLGDKNYEHHDVFVDDEYPTTDDIIRAVWNGNINYWSDALTTEPYDGVIFRNIDDNYINPDSYSSLISNVYITRTPAHIKSATKNNGEFALKDRDVYHQATRNADEFTLTLEAQEQMEAVRRKYEGTSQWLKAPNSKDTNLTEQQWLAVRTPNFKRWFGDWEKHPELASKILDENGEPLVVYHGTMKGNNFSIFNTEPQGAHFGTEAAAYQRGLAKSGYNPETGDDIDWEGILTEEEYEDFLNGFYDPQDKIDEIFGPDIFECFLNIRSPIRTDDQGDDWEGAIADAKRKGHDGIIYENDTEDVGFDSYVVFEPAHIKSATKNNGEFALKDRDVYHQAVEHYERTLADADPDKIDFGNLAHKGFISDERYHQDSLHGTGHIIIGNRMKLSKVGTGESGQYRGWGVYSAQARGVAESYRRYGLPDYHYDRDVLSITLKDGTILDAVDYFYGYSEISQIFRRIDELLNDEVFNTEQKSDTQRVIDKLRSRFLEDIYFIDQSIQDDQESLDRAIQNNDRAWIISRFKQELETHQYRKDKLLASLEIIDNISDFQLPQKNRGNIYRLDVPENDIILDWDASLEEQPEHVKQAIEKIKEFIHKQGKKYRIGTKKIDKADTGGALYMEIVDIMERYLARHTPNDGVTQAKKRTSLLFDKFGVPGLRFLDQFSRRNINDGEDTYNFVTWNEDYIKVLGIDPDSDTEAIEYFERYRAEHPDGFITPEAIERFDQLVTHATGNIILGNKFDLRYVGSSEGGDMFGYGAYFEQSPEVAKSYRRYGLQNMGFDEIDVRLSNGTVLSLKEIYKQLNNLRYNPDASLKLPSGVSNTALADALKELIHDKIEASRNGSSSWDFSKAIKKLIHDIERDAKDAANNGRVNFSRELRETAKALRAIKSMEFLGEKRGNIYQFDIPEDYELLDWDKELNKQSKQITPIVKRIVRAIQNHPEEFISIGLAKNQKDMQAKLQPLLAALARNIKGDNLEGDVHDWRKL